MFLSFFTIKYARFCIGFFGKRSGGLRIDDRALPRVADRGALYWGLLLNTDTKLNKQSWTMYQGWSRRNNLQAKVLTSVPMAAWHQGVVFFTVSLENQVTFQSIETLPLHAGLCRGEPNTSLTTREIEVENDKLNFMWRVFW